MLETTWFVIWVLLWAIYLILDGFDLGMGSIMPFVAKNNQERRIIFNAAGPYWDANEVWLITAGGVTFAAFPKAYAVMFSALYAPLLLLLFALIFRAVAFEFRSKMDNPKWQGLWDIILFLGSFLPALLLGVFFSNLFQGIPVDTNGVYHGNLLKLLNPYGLLGGALFVFIFATHGSIWLSLKSSGDIHKRANSLTECTWNISLVLLILFYGLAIVFTPIWENVAANPFLYVFFFLSLLLFICLKLFLNQEKMLLAWFASAGFILFFMFFMMLGMFPNLLYSSYDPAASLTVFNASSSQLTLKLMLIVSLITVPVVIAYQIWAYLTFAHKITQKDLDSDHSY